MLFNVKADGSLVLVSDEDLEMQQDFDIMDAVRESLGMDTWTEVII